MLRNRFSTLFSAISGNESPLPHHSTRIGTEKHGLEEVKLEQPMNRAHKWLEQNKQTFTAETENGITFKDNFVSLLILELSKRWYVSKKSSK